MRKVLLASVVAVALAGDLAAVHIGKTDFNGYPVVIPAVKKLVPADGAFALPSQLGVTPMPDVDLTFLQKICAAEVKGGCVRETAENPHVRLVLDETASPKSKEGYFLRIESSGIEIRAQTSAGLFYGLQTLGWMIRNRTGDALKCCTVEDWPDIALRGIMRDLDMNDVPSEGMDRLCGTLDAFAALKCNCIYCDFSKNMPLSIADEFNRKNSLTKGDIEKFVAAAKRNHIEIIPTLQCVSHAFWMTFHKDWANLTEGKPRIPWVSAYCPRNPEAKRIVETVVREMCDLFRPRYFGVNLDEICHGPYGKCPRCAGKDNAQAVIDHMLPIQDLLLKRGIRPIVAHDEFIRGDAFRPDCEFARCLDAFDKRTVVLVWLYDRSPSRLPFLQFKDKGFETMFMSWMNFLPNTENLPVVAASTGTLGGFVSYWGLMGPTLDDLDRNPVEAFLGTLAHAARSWNVKAPDFLERPYDGMEQYRSVFAPARNVRFAAPAAELPLDGAFNALVGGTNRRYPALDKDRVAGLVQDAAADGERYRVVRNGSGDRVKAIVLAGSADDAGLPKDVRIPVGARTEGFSFLMAAAPWNAWVKRVHAFPEIVRMTAVYEDGSKTEFPLAYNRDIVPWNGEHGPAIGRVVVRTADLDDAVVHLCACPWKNPRPETPVREIVFSSALYDGVATMIFAAATHGPAVSPSAASSPVVDLAVAAPVFTPLHDFGTDGMTGVEVVHKTKDADAEVKKEIVSHSRRGSVLRVTVPPPKTCFNQRIIFGVPVPEGVDGSRGTFAFDVFCDRPEAITRADAYLIGKPGCRGRLFFDYGSGLRPGWTRVVLPVSVFDGEEDGGAEPGSVRQLRIGFFLGSDRPVTFALGRLGHAREDMPGRFDIKCSRRAKTR